MTGFRHAASYDVPGDPIVEPFPDLGRDWYAFRAPETDRQERRQQDQYQPQDHCQHDESIDIRSLGAILYVMLTGIVPFRGSGRELRRNKHTGSVVFDIIRPSQSAQQLVHQMLQVDPRDRPSVEQLLEYDWLLQPDNALSEHDLSLACSFFMDWQRNQEQFSSRR